MDPKPFGGGFYSRKGEGFGEHHVTGRRECQPQPSDGRIQLTFPIEASGFGSVLVTHAALEPKEARLLAQAADWAKTPLASLSNTWKPMHQELVQNAKTHVSTTVPDGMILIPAADYDFVVQGMPIEGGGEVTSGSHSPMLGIGIGLGYVPAAQAKPETELTIDVRGRPRRARVVKKPIYKRED